MVIKLDNCYPENEHLEEFDNYNFELDHFQKHAISNYNKNNHILITAHTGSGKTLPAEYAIQKAHVNGKKSIYTAPIKSLSNQKFNEFTQKYPNISFGILTGDIKFNPEADCLIMTTEILRNTLFQNKMNNVDTNELLHFNMNIENELECVIFDEVHYINDESRGKVWEETIMMMPHHVKLVMLSATINNIENFANWIQKTTQREVAICSTNKRVVPLTHYVYSVYPKSFYKGMPESEATNIQSFIQNPVLLKEQNSMFRESNLVKTKQIHKQAQQKNIYVKSSFVLKNIVTYLQSNNLLPAICFVFSRKNVEKFAKELNMNLVDNGNEIEAECNSILKKLPNYKEYQQTQEYENMVQLLRKGIAIHHSGVVPILREMVELLFSKGYIKILFATETFAVGVNMPTKTVLFTNLHKYTDTNFRRLYSHEYTQMAGRAGRRGLDKLGAVIHLINMFNEIPLNHDYKFILSGESQKLVSKFKLHSGLVLRILSNQSSVENFVTSSMITNEITKELEYISKQIEEDTERVTIVENSIKYKNETVTYHNMLQKLETLKNKQRKKMIQQISNFENEHKNLVKDYEKFKKVNEIHENISNNKSKLINTENYITRTTNIIIENLVKDNFVTQEDNKYILTLDGLIASNIQEVHGLVMSKLLNNKSLNSFSGSELASYFSIFTPIRVSEQHKVFSSNVITNENLKNTIQETEKILDYFYNQNISNYLEIVDDYSVNFDIIEEVFDWCEATDELQCKAVLESIKEKGIFVGEFVKALLKINNIVNELEKVCNLTNNLELLKNLSTIKNLTLKYIVSSQSLYL